MSSATKTSQSVAHPLGAPDITVNAHDVFGLDIDMEIPAFSETSDYVPAVESSYQFNHDTTLAILAGFGFNRRVMIQGYHGTGKSTHIEQIAARLNWPCIRVNLDSHISRIDLIGKDAIVLRDGKQVTEFREGILPWALQNPVALVFDEYGRPFIILKEQEKKTSLKKWGNVMKMSIHTLNPVHLHRAAPLSGRKRAVNNLPAQSTPCRQRNRHPSEDHNFCLHSYFLPSKQI